MMGAIPKALAEGPRPYRGTLHPYLGATHTPQAGTAQPPRSLGLLLSGGCTCSPGEKGDLGVPASKGLSPTLPPTDHRPPQLLFSMVYFLHMLKAPPRGGDRGW